MIRVFALAALLLVATACAPVPDDPGVHPVTDTGLPPRPPDRTVTVERIVDGNTLELVGGEQIYLLTVDSPELNFHTNADDAECGAEAARDALSSLLPAGASVDLAGLPDGPARDRLGRALSNVFTRPPLVTDTGPINVSLWLVEHGWARAYLEYRTVQTDEAVQLETQAREQRRGMWAICPGGGR